MKRREFLAAGAATIGLGTVVGIQIPKAHAAAVTDADILKEGQPSSIANYCDPKKKGKACPAEVKGLCDACQFYNKPEPSETTFKGKKVAKCQLLATKPQYVYADFTCATFVKKS